MSDAMPEEWRPVVEYEGLYEVSDLGRVRSTRRAGTQGGIKKQSLRPLGHLELGLCKGGHQLTKMVHQIVLEAFVGPCPAGMEILHGDGDPANNLLGNLRYGTSSENKFDTVKHGRHWAANKTHCPQDHEYTPENTYVQIYKGRRRRNCRKCITAQKRAWEQRKARQQAPAMPD